VVMNPYKNMQRGGSQRPEGLRGDSMPHSRILISILILKFSSLWDYKL